MGDGLGGTKTTLYACERGIPSWPINLLYRRCLTSASPVPRGTRSKMIEVSRIALMEIESAGCKVEAVEKAELNSDGHVGEGGQLNVVRVELGLAGKGKSPSRVSGLSRMEDIGCKNASKIKA